MGQNQSNSIGIEHLELQPKLHVAMTSSLGYPSLKNQMRILIPYQSFIFRVCHAKIHSHVVALRSIFLTLLYPLNSMAVSNFRIVVENGQFDQNSKFQNHHQIPWVKQTMKIQSPDLPRDFKFLPDTHYIWFTAIYQSDNQCSSYSSEKS